MALPFEGRVCPAAVLALAALLSSGCSEPEARMCPTGIYCPAGKSCAAKQAICISDGCGNGKLDPGEACDDGNKVDNDGCSADCRSAETCGNGVIDRAAGEVCDDGNTVDNDKCSANCRSLEACGNGITDPNEDCDGGVTGIPNESVETVLCDSDCSDSRCGDESVNATAGEECDGGPGDVPNQAKATPECNTNCTKSACGDGIVNETTEDCDEGSNGIPDQTVETGFCNSNCHFAQCGDGFTNETAGEECDGGPSPSGASGVAAETATCNSNCTTRRCGDGIVNETAYEQCDSGPQDAEVNTLCPYGQKSCRLCSQCQDVAGTEFQYCGDGVPQGGEFCDDGIENDGSYNNGDTSCHYNPLESRSSCDICNADCSALMRRHGPFCGDGVTQDGLEQCDRGPGNGATECPYGQATCTLCDTGCVFPAVREGLGSVCGDGVVDSPSEHEGSRETCDSFVQFICGTCGRPGTPDGCTEVTVASATGTINVRSTSLATITLTLDDGLSDTATTFEFVDETGVNTGTVLANGNVAVNVLDANESDVAGRIVTAIDAARQASLNGLTATAAGPVVTVTNSAAGIAGSTPVVVTPSNTPALRATDMLGGVGCVAGQACTRGEDCVSTHCESGYCNQ